MTDKKQKTLFSKDGLPGQLDFIGESHESDVRMDDTRQPPHFTCPNGHAIDARDEIPVCHDCNLIATHYNRRELKVYNWTDVDDHREACQRLQDEIDAAFDSTYFDGGW